MSYDEEEDIFDEDHELTDPLDGDEPLDFDDPEFEDDDPEKDFN